MCYNQVFVYKQLFEPCVVKLIKQYKQLNRMEQLINYKYQNLLTLKFRIGQFQLNSQKMTSNKRNIQAFETFRDPAVSLATNPTLKLENQQTLTQTMMNQLRYSHLGSNSNSIHNAHIYCPVFKQEELYKCEICSALRQVCPKKRKNIMNQKSFSVQTKNKRVDFNYTDRPRTPQFNQHEKKESFINSMPNIAKQVIRNTEVSAFNYSHSNNTDGFKQISFINPKPKNTDKEIKLINLKPSSNPKKPLIDQRPYSQINGPRPYNPQNIINSSRPATQQHIFKNVVIPHQSRIIEEIIYVPVIKNILVPEVIINPERPSESLNSSKMLLTPRDNINSGSKSYYEHRYDERIIMTPENLRKLAESIIR